MSDGSGCTASTNAWRRLMISVTIGAFGRGANCSGSGYVRDGSMTSATWRCTRQTTGFSSMMDRTTTSAIFGTCLDRPAGISNALSSHPRCGEHNPALAIASGFQADRPALSQWRRTASAMKRPVPAARPAGTLPRPCIGIELAAAKSPTPRCWRIAG